MMHLRTEYTVWDLFGEFGGMMEVTFIIGGILLAQYSEYNFILKALRKLYKAKTKDKNLFIHHKEHEENHDDEHDKENPKIMKRRLSIV